MSTAEQVGRVRRAAVFGNPHRPHTLTPAMVRFKLEFDIGRARVDKYIQWPSVKDRVANFNVLRNLTYLKPIH